jgi:uncharacterized membrane protein
VDGLITGIARHWLFIFNTLWGVYVLLPFLAPILMQLGWVAPARVIYAGYSVLCHQLPDHSYFLFGPVLAPNLSQLQAMGMDPSLNLLEQRTFIGNALAGYKVAICQRDIAIYGSVLLSGLLYALVTRGGRAPQPLDWRLYILLLVPMAIDGITQLFGLRESSWWLRSATGALFGIASVWLAYPYIDGAMRELLREMSPPARRTG